jgi:hypothetical protein
MPRAPTCRPGAGSPPSSARRRRVPQLRRRWVAAVLAGARAVLPGTAWRVAHAPDWPAAERDAVVAELAAEHGPACQFDEDSRIRAGIRISANGNVVDGTLDGLLADRADIGSQLLRLLESEVQP